MTILHAIRCALTGAVVIVAASAPVRAECDGLDESQTDEWTKNFTVENDLFGSGLDRHYTNGLMFSFFSPKNDIPKTVDCLTSWVPGVTKESDSRWSWGFGQKIFTPEDITIKQRQDFTRPYAGWLYGSFGRVNKTKNHLNSFEANLGVVGPASMAEDIQTMWHELIDSPRPEGWDNQLKNEPGLVLSYEYKRRNIELYEEATGKLSDEPTGYVLDLTPHVGASIGNVYSFAAAGGTLRFGKDLPDDNGPPRIRPTIGGSGFLNPDEKSSFYLFAGVEGRAVARNIFLDGNTFGGSPRVDKKILVGDAQAGIVFMPHDKLRLSFSWIYRMREFDRQSDPDVFGAINLSCAF